MKTRIHYLLLLFLFVANGLSAQNVSTGLDVSYAPVPVGGTDAHWIIAAGPTGPAPALREPTYSPYWQTTPVPVTNACWIDQTGTIQGSTPGDYTFETQFTVSPTDGSIVADFGMAWDDVLLSAELVPPSGPAIPLTVPVGIPNNYWVGPSVNYTVTAPVPGTWKIRVVVRFVDSVGGLVVSGEVKHCPKYNISTGIDNAGNAIAVGAADPNWVISAGPGGPVTHRVASYSGYWQATPVLPTNACWINSTGTYNDPIGIETFDRDFVIPSGVASFTTAFGVAWDDVLLSLELVPPTGPSIPLSVPAAPWYTIGPNIGYTVTSPMAGTWKVRAKVQFIDQLGAFILSGYISTLCDSVPPCDCSSLVPDFSYTLDADCNGHFTGSSGSSCFQSVVYDWTVDGTYAGSGQLFDYPFTSNGVHTVCMTATATLPDGKQCKQEICKDVTVDCNPCTCDGLEVDFDYSITECRGEFDAIAQGNSCMQNFAYEWTVNGIIVGTGPTLSFTFPNNGTFTVCVKVSTTLPDGTICEQQVCRDVKVDKCNSCNCEQLNGNFIYTLNGCDLQLHAQVLLPKCMTSLHYRWTVDGVLVGTAVNISTTLPSGGSHVVCLTITAITNTGQQCEKHFCKDIGCEKAISTGGNNLSSGSSMVSLYPNPATDELNVEFTTATSGQSTVMLKTIDGKEILRETRATEAGAQHFRLAIPASVATEMIMVEIDNGTEHIIRKVTVSRR